MKTDAQRPETNLDATFQALVKRLASLKHDQTGVIPWSSPVPSFGDPSRAGVATLGLNPSNREFVDGDGAELSGEQRRFHTLASLGLRRWSDASEDHVHKIAEYCRMYFHRNPYDTWFKQLDQIISGTGYSYYSQRSHACHLDLVPYATANKWTNLRNGQRATLLEVAGDTLALLLRESGIRLLVLNGASVVHFFRTLTAVNLEERKMTAWSLRRNGAPAVAGLSYAGAMDEILGFKLKKTVTVLGYNHNVQSSFGVTREVRSAIAEWVSRRSRSAMSS